MGVPVATPAGADQARVEQLGNSIECDGRVLQDLAARAVDGLFKLRHGGLEIGGVLFGRMDENRIRITDSRPFEPSYAHGPVFRLTPQDFERLSGLAQVTGDLRPVGWYVSHTRSELALTPADEELFGKCFPGHSVTLVLKPAKFDPTRAVAYLRDEQGSIVAGPEFQIAQPEAPPDEAVAEQNIVPATPEPKPESERPVITIAEAAPRDSFMPPLRIALAAVCGGLLIAAAVMFGPRLKSSFNIPPLRPAPVVQRTVETKAPAGPPIQMIVDAQSEVRVQELEQELARLKSQLKPEAAPLAQQAEVAADTPRQTAPPPRKFIPPTDTAERKSTTVALASPSIPVPPSDFAITSPSVTTTVLPTAPAPAAPPPTPTKATAPASGRLIWTGSLPKGGLLFIDGARPSSGAVSGSLPNVPARCTVQTGELTAGGLVIYTSNARLSGRSEAPGPSNGWNHAIYEHDPKRLADIDLMEAPSAANGWKKLVVRTSKRPVNVILIDWEALRPDSHAVAQTR